MFTFILFFLGLCLGSFVNALVWRLHEQSKLKKADSKTRPDLSILKGRSMCPDCGHKLAAVDLVPLISWLSLSGKCRYCRKPISWQYPLVELLTALLFTLSYIAWPNGFDSLGVFQFVCWLIFLVGFVSLAIYDLKWMLLPNKLVFGLGVLAVVQGVVVALSKHDGQIILASLWGLIVLGGLFYVLFQVSGGKWIGGGDVKLGFMLGVLVGGPAAGLLLLFLASFTGTAVTTPLLITGKAKRSTRIPFGPFLLAAAILTQLFGVALLNWYQKTLLFY
jgi:leader peptidase (prepilin peptidase)/N-methyltransferase